MAAIYITQVSREIAQAQVASALLVANGLLSLAYLLYTISCDGICSACMAKSALILINNPDETATGTNYVRTRYLPELQR